MSAAEPARDADDGTPPDAEAASTLRADERAPGLLVGDGVEIGAGVSLGAYVVVHAGTVIGKGCSIEDHVALGARPKLARGSAADTDGERPRERLELADGVTVCSGAVVLAGTRIAAGALIGTRTYVRDRASIGARSVVGSGCVVDSDVSLGERVRVQTNVYLTASTIVEDDVFIGPGVTTTNDDTMARHGPQTPLRGAILRRACRIGGGAVLTPGVEIGEEAFVAAGAVVAHDVPARKVVIGVPARVVRDVPGEDLLERWR